MSDHALARRPRAMSPWTRLAWRQYRLERRMFWRNPSAAFFNFLLPLLFLALFGAIFAGERRRPQRHRPRHRRHERDVDDVHRAGHEHHATCASTGVLKRMRGTPLPTSAYLGGIAAQRRHEHGDPGRARDPSRASSVFGVGLADRTGSSCVVFVALGVVCFASLGVALSHAIPNFDSAPAYVNAVFLPVIFISGVFYDADNAPDVPARHRRRRSRSST